MKQLILILATVLWVSTSLMSQVSETTNQQQNSADFLGWDGTNGNEELNVKTVLAYPIDFYTTDAFRMALEADGAFWCSGSSGATPTSGAGTRLMWIPEKAAFRAGEITTNNTTYWDASSIGAHSAAFGADTRVRGTYSFAAGLENVVDGRYSYAFGTGNTASGNYTSTSGENNTASAQYAAAIGFDNTASAQYALAVGYNNTSSADAGVTMGQGNTASEDNSVAIGKSNTSSGSASGAIGEGNTASGTGAIAMGFSSDANNDYCVALGVNCQAGDGGLTNEGCVALGDAAEAYGHDSFAAGEWIKADGEVTIAMGCGSAPGTPLINNIDESFGVGFRTDTPSFFVGTADGSMDETGDVGIGLNGATPAARLDINMDASTVITDHTVVLVDMEGSDGDNYGVQVDIDANQGDLAYGIEALITDGAENNYGAVIEVTASTSTIWNIGAHVISEGNGHGPSKSAGIIGECYDGDNNFGVKGWAEGDDTVSSSNAGGHFTAKGDDQTTGGNTGVYGTASGDGSTNYGGFFIVTDGTGNDNYGVYASCTTGTTNHAGYFNGDLCYTGIWSVFGPNSKG